LIDGNALPLHESYFLDQGPHDSISSSNLIRMNLRQLTNCFSFEPVCHMRISLG
jgi:hypothetical protein